MESDRLDIHFQEIIKKAEKINRVEITKLQRIELLSQLRALDVTLYHKITTLKKKIEIQSEYILKAKELKRRHSKYFELLKLYEGDILQEELAKIIPDYSWGEYSKIQDQMYCLTKGLKISEMISYLAKYQLELKTTEKERDNLVTQSITLMKEIDEYLSDLT